ncbi:MAG: hypothetical protein ACI841_000501 [Planctomycetota bacterium]
MKFRLQTHLFVGCLSVAIFAASCGDSEPEPELPPPAPTGQVLDSTRTVIVVVVDGVSAKEVTPYGCAHDTTPALARIAQESVVFGDHIAVSLGTNASLAAVLTGGLSQQTGVGSMQDQGQQKLGQGQETLAERFELADWRRFGSVSIPQLGAAMSGLDQGFERYDAPAVEEVHYRNAQQVLYRLYSLMENALDEEAPIFALLHFADARRGEAAPAAAGVSFLETHLAPFRESMPLVAAALDRAEQDPHACHEDLRKVIGRSRGSAAHTAWRTAIHEGQLAFIDEQLADLRKKLEASGRWEDCMLIVTGTSGLTVLKEEHEGGPLFAEEMMHIPLVARFPGGGMQGRMPVLTQPIDIATTISSYVGLESKPTFGLDLGVDLLDLIRDGVTISPRIGVCESAGLDHRAVIDSGYTLEPHAREGTIFSQRPYGMPILKGQLDAESSGRRSSLVHALEQKTPAERWEVSYGAQADSELTVVWRYLRGFAVRREESGGVSTKRRGLPTTVSGQATLTKPSPTLDLIGNRRDLPLRLDLTATGDTPLSSELIMLGDATLATVPIPRLADEKAGDWPSDASGEPMPWSAELAQNEHFWWRLDVGGTALDAGADVEVIAAIYPPGNLDEELEWDAEYGVEVEVVPGRLDAVRITGKTPLDVLLRRLPRRQIAFAVRVDGKVLDNDQLRYQGKLFSAPKQYRLYLPDWMQGVTDELDRPADRSSEVLPPHALRISRSGSGIPFNEREPLPEGTLRFVRRLGGAE